MRKKIKLEFQANIQEVKEIIEKIVNYFKSNNAFDESDKEMGNFFTEQLTGIISGAGELLKAVLKGHKDSLEQYSDFIDSAKGIVPQIANLLEKDKNETSSTIFGRAAIGRLDTGFINFLETADFKKLRSESERQLIAGRIVRFVVQ